MHACQTLLTWLAENGVTPIRFCADVGIHPTTLYGWEKGKYGPSLRIAFAVETYTKGGVPARLWVPEASSEKKASEPDIVETNASEGNEAA